VSEIAAVLVQEYDATDEEIQADTLEVLGELAAEKLLDDAA
jgi:hypothetical protein